MKVPQINVMITLDYTSACDRVGEAEPVIVSQMYTHRSNHSSLSNLIGGCSSLCGISFCGRTMVKDDESR